MTDAETAGCDAVSASALCELVMSSGIGTLAVVGLTKNAGKTTVINALLSACPGTLGLTSLGLDGEVEDHLTGLAKPRIMPPPGTLVATTLGSLRRSRQKMELLGELPFRTSLGAVAVGRAPGRVCLEVSGPTTLAELRATVGRLHELGAGLVLVDGALNRLGSASPRVSDALILATGAMAGERVEDVVEQTSAALDLLLLPEVSSSERPRFACIIGETMHVTGLDHEGRQVCLECPTTIGNAPALARESARKGVATLVLGGALTEELLEDLARLLPPRATLRIVVRDATVVIAPATTLRRCRRRGITIEVVSGLHVLAVTANPFRRPQPLPADAFFEAIVKGVGGRVPVFDVVSNLVAPSHSGARRMTAPLQGRLKP